MTMAGGAPEVAEVDELAFRLAGIERRRQADSPRIRELVSRVDQGQLVERFSDYRLLGLLGSRLIALCPDVVGDEFAARVNDQIAEARRRHALQSHFARQLAAQFEARGIETLAIKGPLLAERLYSDPGIRRPASDVDFLVRAERLDEAVEELRALDYHLLDDTKWADDLPHYHYALVPGREYLPAVELHWRVHWYETRYAESVLDRSRLGADGLRCADPADELALLLLMYARDGFVGLRLAADLAAWWDVFNATLPERALDPVLEENPKLRAALLAAVAVCENVVGVPSAALVSSRWRVPRRARVATRFASWRTGGGWDRAGDTWESISTNITLIDLLLTPRGAGRVYLRHYYFQPMAVYAGTYGWAPEARIRNQANRAVRAAARLLRSTWRYAGRLWSLRGGARLDPVPSNRAKAEA
jgi:hypothetical protein